MEKISFLELNGMDMSYSSAKEAIIHELEECFLLLLKHLRYNVRMISSCLARKKTMNDFWPLGIGSYGKEEVWFVKLSANGHSILEQLGHKPGTSYMIREKNEFVSQRPNIFSIIPIMYSSIL